MTIETVEQTAAGAMAVDETKPGAPIESKPVESEVPSEPVSSAMADAMAAARAEEAYRLAHADEQQTDTTPETETTPETKPEGAVSRKPEPPAADQQQSEAAAGAKPVPADAPANWPAAMRERFAQLPDPAREIVLDQARNLEAGFTQAMQAVAPLKSIAEKFQSDPKAVLTDLAQRAGVEVWFERPEAADEVPEFATQAELVQYLERKNSDRLRSEMNARAREFMEFQAQQQVRAQLDRELAEVSKEPGFDQQAVLEYLGRPNGVLSARDAYWVTRRADVEAKLAQAERDGAELAALKAAEAKRQKNLTRVPESGGAYGRPRGDRNLSEYDLDALAARRVEQSMAQV